MFSLVNPWFPGDFPGGFGLSSGIAVLGGLEQAVSNLATSRCSGGEGSLGAGCGVFSSQKGMTSWKE